MADASAAVSATVTETSPDKKRSSKERGIDDYKRKIWKLKKELEEQRELSLAVQNEELEKLRKCMIEEKEQAISSLKLETRQDLLQMQSKFTEKEAELSRTVKQRDDQIRSLSKQIGGHAVEVKGVKSAIESAHHDTVARLQREIKQLKSINQDLQQKYQSKQQDYRDKVSELKATQEDAEAERQKLLKDALTAKLNKLKRDQDSGSGGKPEHSKDRDLQNKVTELTVALKRSEKRIGVLKEENANLRKLGSNYKDLDDECAKLKRRNAELASAVKTSGEKNKQLSTAVSTKRQSVGGDNSSPADPSQSVDHAKKLFARQRAKDFAEHARVLLTKDKEIDKLTRKTLSLSDSMSNHSRQLSLQSQFDMRTVLTQSTKERIMLEMKSTTGGGEGEDSESRAALFNVQVDYDSLQDKYDILLDEKVKLDKEIEEFRGRIGEIEQELGTAKKEKTTLQEECETKDRKCVQLSAINNNLTKERQHLSDTVEKLTDELAELKHENKSSQRRIGRLTDDNQKLTEEITQYEERGLNTEELEVEKQQLMDELETVKQQAHENEMETSQLKEDNSVMTSRISELLDDNQLLKTDLKELNISTVPTLLNETEELKSSVMRLELMSTDLREEREELQNKLNEQEDQTAACEHAKLENMSLNEELMNLKEKLDQGSKVIKNTQNEHKTVVENLESQVKDLNTQVSDLDENRLEAQRRIEKLKTDFRDVIEAKDCELESLKDDNLKLEGQSTLNDSKLQELTENLTQAQSQISVLENELSLERSKHNNDLEISVLLKSQITSAADELNSLKSTKSQLEKQLDESKTDCHLKSEQIENLKIKSGEIELSLQQQQAIAEEKHKEVAKLTSTVAEREAELKKQTITAEELEQSILTLDSDRQGLESENKDLKQQIVLKENEKNTLSEQISKLARDLERLQSTHLNSSTLVESTQSQYEETKKELEQLQQKQTELEDSLIKSKHQLVEAKKQRDSIENHAKRKLLTLKQDLTSSYEGKIEKLNQTLGESQTTNNNLRLELDEVKAELEEHNIKQISVYAGDNCYHLYVVRHAYDPSLLNDSSDSPLSSPHKSGDRSTDSALSATERLPDISVNPGDYVFVSGELTEEGFYEGQLLDGRAGLIPSNVLEPLYEFDIYGFVLASEPAEDEADESGRDMSTFNSTMFNDSSLLPSTPGTAAPYPQNITLERQFANGILVGWDSPEGGEQVFLYKIYIDDKLKVSISGRNKNKALVEGVKALEPHRVCVSATTNIGESDRRHCTMMIGEPHKPPSDLTVNAVNSEAARIMFRPHNTNRHHTVCVNEEIVRNLTSSLFQVEIAGLVSQTEYLITVTSVAGGEPVPLKSPRDNPLSVSTVFTMPSADEITNISSDGLEPGYLQKFDEFLDVVVNGSPTPPVSTILDAQSEPVLEEVDFLRSYDAGLNNQQNNRPFSPSQFPHSTPKIIKTNPRHLQEKTKLQNDLSPIIFSAAADSNKEYQNNTHKSSTNHSNGATASQKASNGITSPQPDQVLNGNSSSNSDVVLTSVTDMSNTDSTVTVGAADLTPTANPKSPDPDAKPISVLSDDFPSSRSEKSHKEERTPNKSRSSPLQNKQSLQKMLKSLASKDKPSPSASPSRSSRSHGTEEGGAKAEQIEATPSRSSSQRRREKSSSDKPRPKKSPSSPEKTAASSKSPVISPRITNSVPRVGLTDLDDRRLKLVPRSYRALYDYLPTTMSPNKDSVSEELTFHSGDIIDVYGGVDADGFFLGQIGESCGFVPSNMVEEFKFGAPRLSTGEKKVRALYDYDPAKLSPNMEPDLELGFSSGDIIVISGDMDSDGFYKGYIAGKSSRKGLVPSNYLQEIKSP